MTCKSVVISLVCRKVIGKIVLKSVLKKWRQYILRLYLKSSYFVEKPHQKRPPIDLLLYNWNFRVVERTLTAMSQRHSTLLANQRLLTRSAYLIARSCIQVNSHRTYSTNITSASFKRNNSEVGKKQMLKNWVRWTRVDICYFHLLLSLFRSFSQTLRLLFVVPHVSLNFWN